jgi:regulator of replication initiation timing
MAKSKSDLLREIKKLQADLNSLVQKNVSLTEEQVKLQDKLKGQIVRRAREVKKINEEQRRNTQEIINGISEQERGIKSLTGIYSPMGKMEAQRVNSLRESGTQHKKNIESLSRMQSINEEIANLSASDVIQRESLQSQFNAELESLDKRGKGIEEQIGLMTQTNQLANNYAGLTDKQKQFLEKQRAVLEGIQDTIGGVLETASLLTSTVGGVLGSALIGAGFAIDKLGQSTREFGGFLGGAQVSATGLSLVFPQALEATKGLSAELGGVADLSFKSQLNTNLMATNMGISGGEAAKVTASFARLNDGSLETAQNLAASTKEFAKQNGVIPSQVMADVANSTEEFALYGKDGGKNIAEAAVQAAKLGVNMSTLSNVTDSLLDFESSITKELELGAMLGRNINLNKARQLAYDGQLGASVKETLKEMGGIDAFNKMDVFQKRQAAEAAGMTVEQFQKMADNLDKIDDKGNIQLSTFDTMKETLTGIVTGPLGGMVKGMGSAAIAMGQMGVDVKAMAGTIPGIGKIFNKLPSKGGAGGGMAQSVTPPKTADGGGMSKFTKSVGKIKMGEVLKGAAALVLVAGAVFIFGKAVQEFMKVSWSAVGMAVVSMLALVGAVALLGAIMMSGVGAVAILAGAAAMLIVASSVLVLGHALQAIGTGFEMMGQGLVSLVPQLTTMAASVLPLMALIPVLYGLASGFGLLTLALAGLGIAGFPGLLLLAGIAAISAPIMKLASFFGLGGEESTETGAVEENSLSEYQTQMLQKMDMLIQVTAANKDVYLDKDKVTSLVTQRSEKGFGNVFGLGVA